MSQSVYYQCVANSSSSPSSKAITVCFTGMELSKALTIVKIAVPSTMLPRVHPHYIRQTLRNDTETDTVICINTANNERYILSKNE